MAATGTPTPNIGLRIPIGTDPASVDDINYNSNLLDTKLGAVGSDSVQDQIDTLNGKMSNLIKRKSFIVGTVSVTSDHYAEVLTASQTSLSGYKASFVTYGWSSANNGFAVVVSNVGDVFVSAPNGTTIYGLNIYMFYFDNSVIESI